MGGSVTWSLKSPESNSLFNIADETIGIVTLAAQDFENELDVGADNTYQYVLVGTDADGNFDESLVTIITITDDDDELATFTITDLVSMEVEENDVYTSDTPVVVSGSPIGGSVTWSLKSPESNSLFNIADETIGIVTLAAQDFENELDVGADNTYQYVLVGTDADGNFDESLVTIITITDDDDELATFTITDLVSESVEENDVYTSDTPVVVSGSPIGGSVTWSLKSPESNSLFNIADETIGIVTLAAQDFENELDVGADNTYQYVLVGTDADGNFDESLVTIITITDDDDELATFTITDLVSMDVEENDVYTSDTPVVVSGSPIGGTEAIRWSLKSADSDPLFSIADDTIGIVTLPVQDFEDAQDVGADNTYQYVLVGTDDDGNIDESLVTIITITDDDNESATFEITDLVSADLKEDDAYTSATPTVVSGSPIGGTGAVVWSLKSADSDPLFSIADDTIGVVTLAAQDFEDAQDAGADNTYQYVLVGTDADGNFDESLVTTITITDDDTLTPMVSSVSATDGLYGIGDVISISMRFSESVTVTGTPQLTLETGDTDAVVDYTAGSPGLVLTFTYTGVEGHIAAELDYASTTALALNSGTIQSTAVSATAADLTLPAPGAENSLSDSSDVVLDAVVPVFPDGDTATSTIVVNTLMAYNATATDNGGDEDTDIFYTLSGTDAILFDIVDVTGVVTYKVAEADPVEHDIIITAEDLAGNIAMQAVTIMVLATPTVTITNDVTTTSGIANIASEGVTFTFTFTQPVSGFVSSTDDATNDITVVTDAAGDTDGDTLTLGSLTDTGTGEVYTLDVTPATGHEGTLTVTVKANAVTSDLTDAANEVVVTATQEYDTLAPVTPTYDDVATDNVLIATEQTVELTGTIEYDTTIELCFGGDNEACDNGSLRTIADTITIVVDGDDDTISNWSYTLGGTDITAIGQGTVTLRIASTDVAGNTTFGSREITVDTVAPVFPAGATATSIVALSTDAATEAYNANATDNGGADEAEDVGITYTLSGTDAMTFTIDINTGVVTFKSAPSVAAQHEIMITATDLVGNPPTTQTVTIMVQDVPILVYSGDNFTETDANDGTVTGSIIATLGPNADDTTDTFVEDVVTSGHVTADNVPAGMIPAFIRTDNNVVILTLTGKALAHEDTDDVSNLTITFADTAFTTGGIVANQIYTTGSVGFTGASKLTYAGTFTESMLNDGAVTSTNSITATLSGATTFAADVAADGSVTATNVPAGLTAVFTRNADGTVVTLTLTGNAIVHEDSNDVSDLTITFEDTAFALESADTIADSTYSSGMINFKDASTLTYDRNSFSEAVANDGTIGDNPITITLEGDTFPSDVVSSNYVSATGVPDNLRADFAYVDATTVTLTLSGTAVEHAVSDNVNLMIIFTDDAFVSEDIATIADSTYTTAIDFRDAATLNYEGEFTESPANDGSVTGSITATLSGRTFATDVVTSNLNVIATNVPAGLTAAFALDSTNTVVTLTLIGNAEDHEHGNDVSNLTITFTDAAFVTAEDVATVADLTYTTGEIDFRDASFLTYEGEFTESITNDGSVTGSITATLTGDTFNFNGNNDDILDSTVVSVSSGLPPGLTAVFTRTSDTVVTLTLIGTATLHGDGAGVSNLTIAFEDLAFTNEVAANITGSTVSDRMIDFSDAVLTYTGRFTEADANDGSVTTGNSIVATLTGGGTFATSVISDGVSVVATEFPAGMTPVFTLTSPTVVTLTLTGNATDHEDDDDVSNLTITFIDSAFDGISATNVINSTYITGEVDFRDPSTLTYEGEFTESTADDGTVPGTITIGLTGDTFTDNVHTDGSVTASGVPNGMTAEFGRTDSTTVTLMLTGIATPHDSDVALTITFENEAFSMENASTIDDSTSTITIDFNVGGLSLAYTGSFTESDLNNGTVPDTITIALTGDTFADDVHTNGSVTASGVPTGMAAEFGRTDSNTVTLMLTGTTIAHADDVDLTITFGDGAFVNVNDATTVANSIYTTTIDFRALSSLAYAGTFTETDANDGTVTGRITATLTADVATFTDNVHTDGSVTARVPDGLTAVFNRPSDTEVTLTLIGQATAHHILTDTDANGVEIDFTASAFLLENIATIRSTSFDTNIAFRNVSLAYAGTFTETDANDGTVTGSITATLSVDTFVADVVTSNYVSATTIPDGLTAVFTRTSDTEVTLTLTGTATAHSKSNEADLIIEFTAGAFVSERAATTVYTTTINFNDDALTFGAETIPTQRYMVGDVVNEILPEATGGALPLSYSMSSLTLFPGLTFDAATRTLAGTPTSVASATVLTYTVTDNAMPIEERQTAALDFMVSVIKGDQPMDFGFRGDMHVSSTSGEQFNEQFIVPVDLGNGDGMVTYGTSNEAIATATKCSDDDVCGALDAVTIEIGKHPGFTKISVTKAANANYNKATDTFDLLVVEVNTPDGGDVGDDETGEALAVNDVGGNADNDLRLFLPDFTESTEVTVGTYNLLPDEDTPAAPDRVDFSGVTMDIASGKPTSATVCLSTKGVAPNRDPILYHLADPASPWQEIGRDTTTREDFVCGPTASFSPFAVGYVIPPEFAMNASIDDESYTVGISIEPLSLPGADNGVEPLAYTLEPILAGLTFDPVGRMLTGTPAEATTTAVSLTYTVTDSATPPAIDSLTFMVTVNAGLGFSPDTIPSQDYTVDTTIDTLDLPIATGGTAPLTYTLMRDTTILDWLSFDPGERTLDGTPTMVTTAVPLTYTVTDKNDATASLTFTVTVMPETDNALTTRLNELILTRASQAMTASTLDAVARRVEAAAGGDASSAGNAGTTPALAYQFGGQSSLNGLLKSHGKAMLEDNMEYERLFDGASFVVPLSAAEGGTGGGGSVSVWGGSDFRSLESDYDGLDWEGEVVNVHVGVDGLIGKKALAGLALSVGQSSFDYIDTLIMTNGADSRGEYNYTSTNLHPYFGWFPNAGLKLWAIAGFGSGEIEITAEEEEEARSTDTAQQSLAGGFSRQLVSSTKQSSGSTTTLDLKGDVSLTSVAVEEDLEAEFNEQDVSSSRVRLLLSGDNRRILASGGRLTPSLEVGVRGDGGDGITGAGFELGGGLSYANPSGNFTIAGNIRTLLGHDYNESGAGFLLQKLPSGGRGLSLSLHPVWGQAQSATDQLWDADINEIGSDDTALQSSLSTEVGYGVAASMMGTSGVLTPYTGLTTENGETNRVRLGTRFSSDSNGLSVDLEGARNTAVDGASHTVLLRGTVDF